MSLLENSDPFYKMSGDNIVSCAIDDTVRFTPKGANEVGAAIKLDSQPRGVASHGGTVVVASISHVITCCFCHSELIYTL